MRSIVRICSVGFDNSWLWTLYLFGKCFDLLNHVHRPSTLFFLGVRTEAEFSSLLGKNLPNDLYVKPNFLLFFEKGPN